MPVPIVTFKSYDCGTQTATMTVDPSGGIPDSILVAVVVAGSPAPTQPSLGSTIPVMGSGDCSGTIAGGPTSGSYDVYWWVRMTSDRNGPASGTCGGSPPPPPPPV